MSIFDRSSKDIDDLELPELEQGSATSPKRQFNTNSM